MVARKVVSGVLLGVLAAAPTLAADGQRRRGGEEQRGERAQAQEQDRRGEGAVSRSRAGGRTDEARREQARRAYRAEQPQAQVQRQYDARRNDAVRRQYQRPYYYSNRGYYGSRTVIVRRFITPRFVTVVPYRPYFYRPSIGIGIYYGTGGSYPYGYTPRGYYEPIVGRAYGGLRITGASQIAQVFADGYYVGIVNDFDGVFQHLNLEAGPHQIEIREPGLEPIAFDVMVQPGRTITFRADVY